MKKKVSDFLDDLSVESPEAMYPTGMEDAIIGKVERKGLPVLVLLDREKCIKILVTRDKMSYEAAEEFFDFNVVDAYMGEGTPAFATLL